MDLIKELPGIVLEQSMSMHHPLTLGGTADFVYTAETITDLVQAVATCIQLSIPYAVLGEKRAVTFTDSGFPGVIILNRSRGIAWTSDRSQAVVETGVSLKEMVLRLASKELGGLVPFYAKNGSLGGALYGNESVQAHRLLPSVRYVTVLNPPDHRRTQPTVSRQSATWLGDGLRLAAQKAAADPLVNQPVLLSATLQLTSLRQDELAQRIQKAAKGSEVLRPGLFNPLWRTNTALERLADLAPVGILRFSKRYPGLVERQKGLATSRQLHELLEAGSATLSWEHKDIVSYGTEFLGVW